MLADFYCFSKRVECYVPLFFKSFSVPPDLRRRFSILSISRFWLVSEIEHSLISKRCSLTFSFSSLFCELLSFNRCILRSFEWSLKGAFRMCESESPTDCIVGINGETCALCYHLIPCHLEKLWTASLSILLSFSNLDPWIPQLKKHNTSIVFSYKPLNPSV